MMVAKIFIWRWLPFWGRCEDHDAPFRHVFHIGYWLIFVGRNQE